MSFYCICLWLLCLSYQRPAAGVPLPRFSSTHARPNQFRVAQLENAIFCDALANHDSIKLWHNTYMQMLVPAMELVMTYVEKPVCARWSEQCCSGSVPRQLEDGRTSRFDLTIRQVAPKSDPTVRQDARRFIFLPLDVNLLSAWSCYWYWYCFLCAIFRGRKKTTNVWKPTAI